ncbi:MAG: hypothetical protein Q4G03_05805 [Planctomycetia bacterium]|nr:hypothetical protein [Planctomycetia bacterium]
MKRYCLLLVALLATLGASNAFAADFGDLLERLNSRDFSAERDVVTGKGGVYVGELVNPHSETPMFKARDEFRAKLTDATQNNNQEQINDLRAFIADAVKADVSDETKVWLLEQLGVIGTVDDVPMLEELLTNPAQRVVDAAAACLATLPFDEVLPVLEKNKEIPAVAAALAFRQEPIYPYDLVEPKAPLALSNSTDEQVAEYLKGYEELDDWGKEVALASLTARDDKVYRPYAIKALESDSAEMQMAGFLALEKMATSDDVKYFIARLATNRDLAIRLCTFVVADGFDDQLLKIFDQTTDEELFQALVQILSARAIDVRPRIFAKTTAKDCPNRLTLLQQVKTIATPADTPAFFESIAQMPRGKDHDAAENLLATLCNKDATPILALLGKYPPELTELIYTLAARTGGDAAKDAIGKLLDSSNENERALGLRVLNVWADGQFIDKMETLLASNLPDAQFIPLQRAYIRTVSLPDDQIGIELSRDAKLEKLQKAYASAKRPDEKALVLSRLAANRTEKSLQYAIDCANDSNEQVRVAAHKAIADHVHDTILRKSNPELAAKGIEIVLKDSKDKDLIERVNTYKGRMEQ